MSDACISTVKGHLGSVDSTQHSPVTSTAASPYLPLTPDTSMSSAVNSPVSLSASNIQHRGSSVGSLPSVGVDDRHRQPSPSHGHTRHRSVDFALADIVPDLSETIDTDFLHATRSHVFVLSYGLPYVIGQTIIFSCCFFLLLSSFFSSPNLSDRRLDFYRSLAHGVALVRI